MTVSIEEYLPPVLYNPCILTTVARPGTEVGAFKSQVMPFRHQTSQTNHPENRHPHPKAGQTYTVHRDMSGLKSDLLGHVVDLYA
jgi:hypothetical protein